MTDRKIESTSREAVEALIESDPEFARLVRTVAVEALKSQLYFIKHGTPDQRMQIARAFLPVFTRALQADKTDKNTEDMLAEVRSTIVGVLGD